MPKCINLGFCIVRGLCYNYNTAYIRRGRSSLFFTAFKQMPLFQKRKQNFIKDISKEAYMKVLIIGGVAGGASAAARLRRLSENAEIKIFERSGHMSYANCGLPYFIADVIKEEEMLYVQTPEAFKQRFNVDVFVRHEVTKILPEKKQLEVKNLETGEVFFEDYDKLIISTGAKPIKPSIEGINSEKVMTLRTVEDAVKIKSFVDENKPQSVIIAGGGFIGVELAEGLIERGLKVKIVQRPNQL